MRRPSCSRNAHDKRDGSGIRVVPCARSAHDRNVLAGRAQLDHYGCPFPKGVEQAWKKLLRRMNHCLTRAGNDDFITPCSTLCPHPQAER